MKTTFRLIAVGSVVVASAAIAQPAVASDTDTIAVSATVTKNCIIDASALAFDDVNTLSGQPVDAAGTIDVTCTNETPWTASANAGQAKGATFGERKLMSGENELNYALYTNSARTTLWGDGETEGSGTLGDTGSGSSQQKTFYGRIAANQTSAPAGVYNDTVTVTVSY